MFQNFIFLPVKNVQTRVELMLEVVPLVLEFAVHVSYLTQGVLASTFPISILTRTQGQHRCQKVKIIPKDYVPV